MVRPRAILGLLAALGLASATSAQHASPNCLGGCPEGSPDKNVLVEREIYTLSASPETRFSDWVAYKVTKASQAGSRSQRNWKEDPELNGIGLEPTPKKDDDYRGAFAALGTNRGHQAPLAAFTGTPHWRDTNFLSNITPQMGPLSQGPWQRLERAVRELAFRDDVDEVFVMTGTLHEREMPQLPNANEPHLIPSGYWKVVAVRRGSRVHAAAFIMDQDAPRNANYCTDERHVTVEEVETRTELDLFPKFAETTVRERRLAPEVGCP